MCSAPSGLGTDDSIRGKIARLLIPRAFVGDDDLSSVCAFLLDSVFPDVQSCEMFTYSSDIPRLSRIGGAFRPVDRRSNEHSKLASNVVQTPNDRIGMLTSRHRNDIASVFERIHQEPSTDDEMFLSSLIASDLGSSEEPYVRLVHSLISYSISANSALSNAHKKATTDRLFVTANCHSRDAYKHISYQSLITYESLCNRFLGYDRTTTSVLRDGSISNVVDVRIIDRMGSTVGFLRLMNLPGSQLSSESLMTLLDVASLSFYGYCYEADVLSPVASSRGACTRVISGGSLEDFQLEEDEDFIDMRLKKALSGEKDVLLLGATGCGKTTIAKLLHANSPRRDRPNVKLDASEYSSKEWMRHALHGGRATDMPLQRGRLLLADGGTLFIDNIHACDKPALQVLRSIMDDKGSTKRAVEPIGADRTECDVRLILSATEFTQERNELSSRMSSEGLNDITARLRGCEIIRIPPYSKRKTIALRSIIVSMVRKVSQRQEISRDAMNHMIEIIKDGRFDNENGRRVLDVIEWACFLADHHGHYGVGLNDLEDAMKYEESIVI